MSIGSQVRKYRKLKRWTLRELGERSGLAIGTLSDIEVDRRPGSIKAVTKIAEALGVDVDYLFKKD